MNPTAAPRPHTTVILAMSADGKIADRARSAARFGSERDRQHLEYLIGQMDAVLLGAGTLRAYGTSLPITNPDVLAQRHQRGQPPQPVHIICSASGNLDPELHFFRQPLPRWLLTTPVGAGRWYHNSDFDQVLVYPPSPTACPAPHLDWLAACSDLYHRGLHRLAVLGGGRLISTLLRLDLIDELQLTICPLLLGGSAAPTPVDGEGFLANVAPCLQLLSVQAIADEVFLHYRVHHPESLDYPR